MLRKKIKLKNNSKNSQKQPYVWFTKDSRLIKDKLLHLKPKTQPVK